jgi:hypothetical protein
LAPADLGLKDSGELLLNALHVQGWSAQEGREKDVEDEMHGIAASADRWFFTNDGIEIRFNAYEGGCYVCTPPPTTIQWADLKPLLDSRAIVP